MIGYLVWWDLRGVMVSHAELGLQLVAAGFPLPHRRVRTPTNNDSLSRLVVQAVEYIPGTVGVRRDGGLVFAPRIAYSNLDRLRAVIAGLPTTDGTPASLHLVNVADTPENCAVLAGAVMTGILQDLVALERELDHLQARATLTRPRTIDGRLTRLQALIVRASTHEMLLSLTQREAVATMVDALYQRLTKLQRARAER